MPSHKATQINLGIIANEMFDISLETEKKQSTFNSIVKDFTSRITIRNPINLVRVECVGMIDTGSEIKYNVIFSYHSIRTKQFEVKQSTFERLVMLACEKDGITNMDKYKHMICSIDMGLIDRKLAEHNMQLDELERQANYIKGEMDCLLMYRKSRMNK